MGGPRKKRELTELEGAALGVVVRDGPCTAYAVKELFRGSPSDYWSGSAGSIYPLMRRLEERGLVRPHPGAAGRRGHTTYRATPGGRRAFNAWLTDAGRAAAMGLDPLRTRLVYIGSVSATERARFRAAVIEAIEALPSPPSGTAPELAKLHRIWTRARRRALDEVLDALSGTDPVR